MVLRTGKSIRTIAAFAVTCGVVAGCGGSADPPSQHDAATAEAKQTDDITERGERPMKYLERAPEASPAITGEAPDATLSLVLDDLESRVGAPRAEFSVLESSFQEWPDGSMGCAVPGEIHTQVPVSGYRVVVFHRGTRYDYRVSERGVIRLCRPGRTPRANAPVK